MEFNVCFLLTTFFHTKKKIDLRFEVRNENKNIDTMSSIQQHINNFKNSVCIDCKETNFHINMVIRYEGGEPHISYGDALSVWCSNCNDECYLVEKEIEEEGSCKWTDEKTIVYDDRGAKCWLCDDCNGWEDWGVNCSNYGK